MEQLKNAGIILSIVLLVLVVVFWALGKLTGIILLLFLLAALAIIFK